MRFPAYIIWSAALAALLTGCGPGKEKARVKGNFDHVQRAELYLYCADGTQEGIDTLRIERGKFKGDITVNEPCLYTLLLQSFTEYSIILEPGATISINGDAQKLAEMEISGTEENELLTDFRRQTLGKKESDIRRAATDFIRSHPKSLAAIAVLRDVFLRPEHTDVTVTRQLLEVLHKAQPQSRALRFVEQGLRPKLNATLNTTLPDFTATDIKGVGVNTTNFKGAPLLIAFVATWTQNYNEMARVLHVAKDKGPEGMRVLLLSLDTDIPRFKERVMRDSLSATVICDGKSFDSPLATTLGIRYVPSIMLVGSNGKIITRDIEPKRLETEILKLK